MVAPAIPLILGIGLVGLAAIKAEDAYTYMKDGKRWWKADAVDLVENQLADYSAARKRTGEYTLADLGDDKSALSIAKRLASEGNFVAVTRAIIKEPERAKVLYNTDPDVFKNHPILYLPGGVAAPPSPGEVGEYPDSVFDDNMTDEERDMARALLLSSRDPDALEAAASVAQASGHPKTAALLRQRAEMLRDRHTEPTDPMDPLDPTQPAPTKPQLKRYTIKSGDIPYLLARRFTGDADRWPEIAVVNPGMEIKQVNGTTQLVPWRVRQTINLPPTWGRNLANRTQPKMPPKKGVNKAGQVIK